jgi:alpha-tubulin suppressor-like RCC1 family protein
MPHVRGSGPATAAALVACLVLACRENLHPPGGPVASLQVAPAYLALDPGDTATFTATARNAAGQVLAGIAIAWTSSDTAVASVGPTGLVRGVAAGTATIRATAELDTGTARVTVLAHSAGVRLVPASATLVPGGSLPLAVLPRDPSGPFVEPTSVVWSSSDTFTVRVSPDGTVSAVREGAAWVVARLWAWSDSTRVGVVAATFSAVSAGPYRNTCATGPQGAFCWGHEGFEGQLGAGLRLDAVAAPVGVLGGERLVAVSAGNSFTCGLTADGAPFCWGSGVYGRVGDGTVDSVRVAPVPVAGNLPMRAISAGRRHACGLRTDGLVTCWGSNAAGALGSASAGHYSALPVTVETTVPIVSVGVGYMHSCALAADSVAYCWGHGARLGDGTGLDRAQPAPVSGGHRFTALSVGWNHSCGLTRDGTVWCWGYNTDGELGRVTGITVTVPVSVDGAPVLASVTAGYLATCGLTADGRAYCWGWNGVGQLGTGDTLGGPVPRPVAGGLRFTALSVGSEHTCGLATDGLLYCWGSRERGMLGDGADAGIRPTPVVVSGQRRTTPARIAQR